MGSFGIGVEIDIISHGRDVAANKEPHQLHTDDGPTARNIELKEILKHCGIKNFSNFPKSSKIYMRLEEYSAIEHLLHDLNEYCKEIMSNQLIYTQIKLFLIVCWFLDDQKEDDARFEAYSLLERMMQEDKNIWDNLPVIVAITPETYTNISVVEQDRYHPPVDIQGQKIHKRFRDDIQECFVISPIGHPGSLIRQRADQVYEMYIKPACETTPYRAVRGEMMRGPSVMPDIQHALETNPMVIAYLGSPTPGWNANVMFELGHRNATGLPMVILKDATTADGQDNSLPFDLKDKRFVEVSIDPKNDLGDLTAKIRRIRELMMGQDRTNGWHNAYPSAVVDITMGANDPNESTRFVEASAELESLFDLTNIKGRTVIDVVKHLVGQMSDEQHKQFIFDQNRIIQNITTPNMFLTSSKHEERIASDITAIVPIVFASHKSLNGRGFLPIIVSHIFNRLTNTFRIRILYLDVTSALRFNDTRNCYECILNAHCDDTQPVQFTRGELEVPPK